MAAFRISALVVTVSGGILGSLRNTHTLNSACSAATLDRRRCSILRCLVNCASFFSPLPLPVSVDLFPRRFLFGVDPGARLCLRLDGEAGLSGAGARVGPVGTKNGAGYTGCIIILDDKKSIEPTSK